MSGPSSRGSVRSESLHGLYKGKNMSKSYYLVTVEFMPDCSEDPDMFRMHRKTEYRIPVEQEGKTAEQVFDRFKEAEKIIDSLDPSRS